ncbi:MAG TPA: protein kinase [Lacipirellulaceae bacterium]|nr:protein kinase [Lacipirellulaceae bacterium]
MADQLRIQFELDQVINSSDMITERSGSVIGRYTLLEQLGEGGMGVVYVAQQDRPVTRKVALKIIKPGMDTKEVITRFEAERQALALMDHANIARVFDAGATSSGRPYFVMELVRGTPITEYCDQNHLTIDKRLELFVQVCYAVQHAHQKGIIHRDLKPSNVLIAQHDGRGVPKIIDFGLAKATGQQHTAKTLLTAFPQMMGTPIYMSPEQAAMTTRDVDTRADIYSLGVLLYELLTGTTPFDPARFRAVGFDEIRRIIREEDPLPLSTQVGMLGVAGAAIAVHRGTDFRRLQQLLRGDLDWIAMRCLEKDRARRYGTASSLALDVERYLNDEPVEACPPSGVYRLRKFIRRNKAGVLAGSTILALLVSAVLILTVSNARIRKESEARAKALTAKESALATTREAIQQMTRFEVQLDEQLSDISGGKQIHRTLREKTLQYLAPIVKQAAIDEEANYQAFVTLESMADIELDLGRYEDARQTCQRGIDIVQKRLNIDPDNPSYLADLLRIKSCMMRIMFIQFITENDDDEEEAELVAYGTELLNTLRDHNCRFPENLRPMAYQFWVLGKIAIERHGDKVTAERLFRESVWHSKTLPQNSTNSLERHIASKNAIWLGRLLQDDSTFGPQKALPMFEQAHRWAQTELENRPAMWTRQTAAVAELELGICHFHMQPSERACTLVQHACAELRRQSVNNPSDTNILYQARRGQAALVRQFQRLGRTPEAAEAARHMAVWLEELKPLASSGASVHRELQLAQTESLGLLHASGQLSEAVEACRQQISFWEEVQRDNPSKDFKPYLAGRYLTLTRLLTELGEDDEAKQAAAQAHEMGLNSPQTFAQLARDLVIALYAAPLQMAWQNGTDASALAVEAAQKAVDASPNDGFYWNTLGAAQYCAGEWQSSMESLQKSVELRAGGDATDWYFVAMAHWQLGRHEQARKWYDRASQWMKKNQRPSDELQRFRAVATELIGVSDAAPTTGTAKQPQSQ